MGISLAWFKEIFKSEKEKEKEALEIELLKQQITPKGLTTQHSKPYISLRLVNNVLIITLSDGNIISKPNATTTDFNNARKCTTEQELLKIASSSEGLEEKYAQEAEVKKIQAVIKGVETLKQSVDFEVIDDAVYLKGVKRSIPNLLVEKFAEIIGRGETAQSVEYQSLKKFWLKCCLNPNAQSAEDLYNFLQYHKFKIDKHGNFYAYRRVVSINKTNKKLVEFVSNAYAKVKAVWKKKPSNYFVHEEDGGYTFSTEEFTENNDLGNLQDLYLNLPNMQEKSYTDAHTHTMDYKVGQSSSIPRNEGNDSNQVSCSKGLHIASKRYNYSGFGDTPVLAIINPMDVLAVPRGEDGKLRTCRWFFAMTLDDQEQFILDDDDFDVSELGDVFEEECLENLEEHVKKGFTEEIKRHTFTLSNISSSEITNIVVTLEDMKNAISKRIAVLD